LDSPPFSRITPARKFFSFSFVVLMPQYIPAFPPRQEKK
jgi:hypothetical protein